MTQNRMPLSHAKSLSPSNTHTTTTDTMPADVNIPCKKESRKSKCRELRWQLHKFYAKNNSPTWEEIRELKQTILSNIVLPLNHAHLSEI